MLISSFKFKSTIIIIFFEVGTSENKGNQNMFFFGNKMKKERALVLFYLLHSFIAKVGNKVLLSFSLYTLIVILPAHLVHIPNIEYM